MISYELAKELKDTGYVGLESGKPNALPDLEELIESCGTEFGRLRVFSRLQRVAASSDLPEG